jgi:hypothetical protein
MGMRRHGSVYFVDDNFNGNCKAALDSPPHLVESNRLRMRLSRGDAQHCEAARDSKDAKRSS